MEWFARMALMCWLLESKFLRMLPKKGGTVSQEANMRRVTAIKNGTVIDHVPAGKALSVLKMLGIEGDMSNPVSLVMNVPSKKMGGKDIIKVENRD